MTVGVGRAECSPTRPIGNTGERSKAMQCLVEQKFVSQPSRINWKLYAASSAFCDFPYFQVNILCKYQIPGYLIMWLNGSLFLLVKKLTMCCTINSNEQWIVLLQHRQIRNCIHLHVNTNTKILSSRWKNAIKMRNYTKLHLPIMYNTHITDSVDWQTLCKLGIHENTYSCIKELYRWKLFQISCTMQRHEMYSKFQHSLRYSITLTYPFPPLDNIRVMVIVWRLRGNIIRTALCWIVWHNVHSQQHTYMSSSYMSNRLGLSHWD